MSFSKEEFIEGFVSETREHLDASNYQYNEEKKCYEMKPAKLSYYGFEYSSITVSTIENNQVKTGKNDK